MRWLTGGYGSVEGTKAHFESMDPRAEAGDRKRGLGVWMSGRLCGYVDYDPDHADGMEEQDVNITYAVHPWARGQGVAVEAVRLICATIRDNGVGSRAAIKVEPENTSSVRVAEKAGFRYVRDFVSANDTHADGTPKTFSLYLLDLEETEQTALPTWQDMTLRQRDPVALEALQPAAVVRVSGDPPGLMVPAGT